MAAKAYRTCSSSARAGVAARTPLPQSSSASGQSIFGHLLLAAIVLVCLALCALPAAAALDPATLKGLASDDPDARTAAVRALGQSADPQAGLVLRALTDDALVQVPDGPVAIVRDGKLVDAASGAPLAGDPAKAEAISINNRLRREVEAAMSASNLDAGDVNARRSAIAALGDKVSAAQRPRIEAALAKETDAELKDRLSRLLARLDLASEDTKKRIAAADSLAQSRDPAVRTLLADQLARESDAAVKAALQAAIAGVDLRLKALAIVNNLFTGISLGSVLLLVALGLAITFGLMGIINMAHGEMLMLGAYATFVVQTLFRRYLPEHFDWYVIAAIPVAFALPAVVGVAIERTVLRWLYGRPLETLLATWGISLLLIQTVRTLFGAQNVEVANPVWLSGGLVLAPGVVLPWNRIVIIGFAALVVFLVWLMLNRTKLGLYVRGVTQNRAMAGCVGVPTDRVDMLTFSLGCGIAGLAGVALSQLGNVGPELGQGYIVDSFMVVVLGGVGQLAGTVLAALGLGTVNKFIEPWSGAVMAKIAILVFIILFIQKRPQGLFALKGRSAEA
jgi:urea transport system permease protein